MPMTIEQRMEQLSRAYIHAIAARANIRCVPDSPDVDNIDVQLKAGGRIVPGAPISPRIEVQLKATASPQWIDDGGVLSIRVPRGNYDGLRHEATLPRLLMVLVLPPDEAEWMELSEEHLITRRSMFWLNLLNFPEDHGTGDKVTVHVPRSNRVTPDAIWGMMERVARKEPV